MRAKLVALITGLGVAALCAPALAHHSFAIEYDQTKPIEGTGIISKVEWTNPHMRVYVDVTEPDGSVTTWNLEMGSVNSILRRGWKQSDLKTGAKVSFNGYAGNKIRTRAAISLITLADGRSFKGASTTPDPPPAK